jgi:hypothetical protein
VLAGSLRVQAYRLGYNASFMPSWDATKPSRS